MKINLKQTVLIIIVLLIIAGFGFLIYENKKNQEIEDVAIYSEIDETQISDDNSCLEEQLISAQILDEETWEENNVLNTKYKLEIINSSPDNIKNWEIQINLNADSRIASSWNGNFSIDNDVLKILPVDYNNEVNSGNKVEAGFILVSNSKLDVENYKLFIDGEEYNKKYKKCAEDISNESDKEDEEMNQNTDNNDNTPVGIHGKLRVEGTDIVDKNGDKFLLKGVSTHGIYWFPQYVNIDTFRTLRDEFSANVIRLAMYTDPSAGYSTNIHKKVEEGVEYAKNLGMYVIIDWHILSDNNPNINKNAAISFFEEMSQKYKDYDNVIYEICNEPNGNVTWENDIKPYAEDLINVIRKNDSDSIIIVGTPNWSQNVDIVANNKIENQTNIMYALHFYADTHRDELRNKLKYALDNSLPVIVSEFGICDASGNGNVNIDEANKWIELLKQRNVSFVCWNLSNKSESSSILNSSTTSISNWSEDELSQCGKWLKSVLNSIN